MSEILLQTKLYRPPVRPSLVTRPRLIGKLNSALGEDRSFAAKLTLVSAPAGFGKTTLVSDWSYKCGRPVVWLTLDEYDNDPAQFFTYLVVALQEIEEGAGDALLAMLHNQQPPPVETLLTALINEITTFSEPSILVLDDYHLIQAQPIHGLLTYFLSHMPPRMHLVLISRTDPQLPLPRMRIRGELIELRAADLAFTLEETAAFLEAATGLTFPSDTLKALETRTEGWVAGLQVAALSLQGQAPHRREDFLKSFTGSHHYVLDFLAEEVLQQQPAEVQDFLLQTAVLDRLSASLCDAVTERSDSQLILQQLEQANLFLVPLDDERRWYRYHHLFADFLRTGFSDRPQIDPALLHQRAAAWYHKEGYWRQVVTHLLAADDTEGAAHLIGQIGMEMLIKGELTTVEKWLDSLPEDVVANQPRIGLTRAWTYLSKGQYQLAQEIIPVVETAIRDRAAQISPESMQELRGQAAAVQATLAANLRQVPETISHSRLALDLLSEDNRAMRCMVQWNLAFAYRLQGDLAAAKQMYEEAIATARAVNNHFIVIKATTGLANVQRFQGDLPLAHQTYLSALDYTDRNKASSFHTFDTHMYLASLQYEWNQLESAESTIRRGIQLSRKIGYQDSLTMYYRQLALVQQAQGLLDEAIKTIRLAADLANRHHFTRRVKPIAITQARLELQRGNLEAAVRLAEIYDLPSIRVRVHIARKQGRQALDLLAERQLDVPEQKGDRAHLIMLLLLETQAYQTAGEISSALNSLARALTLANSGEYIRRFLDEDDQIANLLRQKSVHALAPAYVEKLITAFEAEEQRITQPDETKIAIAPGRDRYLPLIETLSKRELETLRYLATRLSIPEIADEMFVAVSTVRSHTKRVYSKLNVHSRREAVDRADELGLLDNW